MKPGVKALLVLTVPACLLNLSGRTQSLDGGAAEAIADAPPAIQKLKLRVSWGHQSKSAREFYVGLLTRDLTLESVTPVQLESGDTLEGFACRSVAGAGDVDGLECVLVYPGRQILERTNIHSIWRYLLEHSDPDTAGRLKSDAAYRPDTRKLTIQTDREGTSGFSLTIDQLLNQKQFWFPELDIYVSAGESGVLFADYLASIGPFRGRRILDEVEREPEATYAQFTGRWEDMGSPAYRNPHSVWPGHIVGLTWDSALAKFGIDRGANVWNDYGNPDHFSFGWGFGSLGDNLTNSWRGQRLEDGLPIITTTIEKNGVRYEVEQFAYPLNGPPNDRKGDIPMVLFEKVTLTELTGKRQGIALNLTHRREATETNCSVRAERSSTGWIWREATDGRAWLALESKDVKLATNIVQSGRWTTNVAQLTVDLAPRSSRELVLKLPSAPVPPAQLAQVARLDYAKARERTKQLWSEYLARGAQFNVPEESVNTLFRANLWHALRLPRRHGGSEGQVKLDLPYSNFAYDQHGTPWPVNQAVYVDYMLYDLRGYHSISTEELAAIYRNNQEPGGHVGGFANWGVYTPGMIYSVAQHYLLSGDRVSFEALLPSTLKALDWCLAQTRNAAENSSESRGLVLAPLNDLSHDPKAWAFNQAYLYAGMNLLGQALADIGHPRAVECRLAALAIFDAVQAAFGRASMRSPAVELRNHTWIPYVPCDALASGRLMDVWYPTDVDCGALHLSRLGALNPNGALTTQLLLDHEDNLFFNHWGMANEPVYNQHATAYLLRDEPKAAIRAFYSMMACAFSHSVFEPVEHRWAWGQYFGPPSTDGAWFELYRRMLVRETDNSALVLCQATPRKWLENGKRISVERAPTYFGDIDFTIESRVAEGQIRATIKMPTRKTPAQLLLRLRHPEQKALRSVTVNGEDWKQFDVAKEWVQIAEPDREIYTVVARY